MSDWKQRYEEFAAKEYTLKDRLTGISYMVSHGENHTPERLLPVINYLLGVIDGLIQNSPDNRKEGI